MIRPLHRLPVIASFLLVLLLSAVVPRASAHVNYLYFAPEFNPFATCMPAPEAGEAFFNRVWVHANKFEKLPHVYFCQSDFIQHVYAQVYAQPRRVQIVRDEWVTRVSPVYRIDYHPSFLGLITVTSDNEYVLAGILAHQLGHVLHFLELGQAVNQLVWRAKIDLTVPPEQELAADELMGKVLASMGATIDDLIDAQRMVFSLHTHPSQADYKTRLQRAITGYETARNQGLSDEEQARVNLQKGVTRAFWQWRIEAG